MRRIFHRQFGFAFITLAAAILYLGLVGPVKPAASQADDPRFAGIEAAVQEEIDAGHIPGAVVLVGHRGRVVYHQAFGQRCLAPEPQSMTVDTIFDVASLTKVVATTTAIMQLWDDGLLRLDDRVDKYWPEFGYNGKDSLTLRHLLTHTSGLRQEINPKERWEDYQEALEVIAADELVRPPGTKFRYGDVNFIVLGEIVERVSGQSLDTYCTQKIFQPLGMHNTSFNPPFDWKAYIAPCNVQDGILRWGVVQDPTAYRLGGVAGNAGVFSTADDLALFAQMLLDGGACPGGRILSRRAVVAMTKPRPVAGGFLHGLGWDSRSPYTKQFNDSFPAGSFGHTGYTGTSIWIEPRTKTYLIILANHLHMEGNGAVKPLRAKVAAAVAAAIPMGPAANSRW